jgi:molybdate transport system substrate-binding protein
MTLIYHALCFQMNNRFRSLLRKTIGLLLAVFLINNVQAAEVMVAVASNFIKPMQKIASEFKNSTGHEVKIAFGSSGKLLAQITHGAPFELFLSADTDKTDYLIKQDFAVSDSAFIYAQGRLVLWSASDNYIDNSSDILQTGAFKHIALADPKLAPYGQAANEVMQALAVDRLLTPRLVTGENISQTYQFVQTGNAELGFIALSQFNNLTIDKQGSAWLVPSTLHKPINQSAVLLQRGMSNPAAVELLAFLQKQSIQTLIQSFGYDTYEMLASKSYAFAR